MCATIHEWVLAICAHCDPNIPRINGKFKISLINVSPLWHQQDALSFWHPAYASLCAIAIIRIPYLQTNALNKE
jgi:hypothetical protein